MGSGRKIRSGGRKERERTIPLFNSSMHYTMKCVCVCVMVFVLYIIG